jgi:hypothetical protein
VIQPQLQLVGGDVVDEDEVDDDGRVVRRRQPDVELVLEVS